MYYPNAAALCQDNSSCPPVVIFMHAGMGVVDKIEAYFYIQNKYA